MNYKETGSDKNGSTFLPASHADKNNLVIQRKLTIGAVDDPMEAEADDMADKVMRMPGPGFVQRKCAHCANDEKMQLKPLTSFIQKKESGSHSIASDGIANQIQSTKGNGNTIPDSTRSFMESRFGADFSDVNIHTGSYASQLSNQLNAQAFTVGRDIYFNEGKYKPESSEGKHLLAHELTHMVQQGNNLHRKLQIKPPGKGEESAFDRVQELIDRLNTISSAIQYQLDGNDLKYTIIDAPKLTGFDTQMQEFIDKAERIPMRLINSKGLLGDSTGGYHTNVFADSIVTAYVDLDDLLADDIHSFQSDLVHFLTERFAVKNYEKRVGESSLGDEATFQPAHRKGKDAEARFLQDLLKDPSISFNYEEEKGTTFINAFKSKDKNYRIFQIVKNNDKAIAGGKMFIQFKNKKLIPLHDYLKDNPK